MGKPRGESIVDLIRNGRVDAVKEVLKKDKETARRCGKWEDSPLVVAAEVGDVTMIKLLLEAGASHRDPTNAFSPIEAAAQKGRVAALEALLEAQAHDDEQLKGAFRMALAYQQTGTARLLIERTLKDRIETLGPSALHTAVQNGQAEIVRMLVEMGADVNALDDSGETPLIRAAGHPCISYPPEAEFVQKIKALIRVLAEAGADLKATDKHGRTAMEAAINHCNVLAGEALIEVGFDVKALGESGVGLLGYLQHINQGHASHERFEALLREAGAPETGVDVSRMMVAAERGDLEVVRQYLAAGMPADVKSWFGGTALPQAARAGHEPVVEALLAAGAKADLDPALSEAAARGHVEIVKRLLAAGADPNFEARGLEGYTALVRAQEQHHREVVAILREALKARPQARRSIYAGRRGVDTSDAESVMVLVRGGSATVAEGLAGLVGGEVEENVYERRVRVMPRSWMVVQFVGHEWTIIAGLGEETFDSEEVRRHAKELSQALKTRAIAYGVSDTAGAVMYELRESGELLEWLERMPEDGVKFSLRRAKTAEERRRYQMMRENDGIGFESKIRQLEPERLGRTHTLVDELIKEQGAYVPGWQTGRYEDSPDVQLGMPGAEREDLVGMYVVTAGGNVRESKRKAR